MPNPQHQLALPPTLSPDALDALTELATIMARLRGTIESSSAIPGLGTGNTPLPGGTPGLTSGGPAGALSLKDIPTATDNLKHKLQKARAQIRALPDMERSMEQQEEEIRELEEKIRQQNEVLSHLKSNGANFAAEDTAMGDKA
jgi:hypothetical protein